ncbi:hypothetical protein EON65_29870 [archaeon]|nr:MAG: hypothetical protein EON65_29870 [archaeon]
MLTTYARSVDYNAVVWTLQQLFTEVQTMKPNSSRSQSSEIFLVCMGYLAPQKIDTKLFDVNYVFKEVQVSLLQCIGMVYSVILIRSTPRLAYAVQSNVILTYLY